MKSVTYCQCRTDILEKEAIFLFRQNLPIYLFIYIYPENKNKNNFLPQKKQQYIIHVVFVIADLLFCILFCCDWLGKLLHHLSHNIQTKRTFTRHTSSYCVIKFTRPSIDCAYAPSLRPRTSRIYR